MVNSNVGVLFHHRNKKRLELWPLTLTSVPPKSHPKFKLVLHEDGTYTRSESRDRSDAYPAWVWEKYGPKEGRDGDGEE